ncbi:complement C1q subcomponent subunit B [Latimeria chalumnae]|uniref:Complement C1q B chain n=1 Tax=Latimeria chalumnae TaxID=7897 RepID=H3AGK0_LATCH|nr:PREDICTED: complement C1q subcomponent subunit B [Latimeria chalumnae]XP_014349191.1 PREDICTED: complement C1q subcomponent subunit B [Latimeria chalumnae]|eukprot:XP_014349190.1 PREDICTED: complement C1q subcomponent subunit B [Latimeria chalumnae]
MLMEGKLALVGLLLLGVVSLAGSSSCDGKPGLPGLPGIPGTPGPNGKDGTKGGKGDKGLPGVLGDHSDNGEKGEPGLPGPPGKVGPRGQRGLKGQMGPSGPKGEKGEWGDYKTNLTAAFSVARFTNVPPRRERPIRFDKTIYNEGGHYVSSLAKFHCTISGLYYFNFHVTLRGSLCLNIVKQGVKVLGFCDNAFGTYQVSSGGVVLNLRKDEYVWLETTEKNSMLGIEGADSIFSGFLLFPDP